MRNKAGKLFLYFDNIPNNFSQHVKRKANKVITKTESISSVYIPNIELCLGFGDFKHTTDVLLFVFSDDYRVKDTPPKGIEIFIARGQKKIKIAFIDSWQMVSLLMILKF